MGKNKPSIQKKLKKQKKAEANPLSTYKNLLGRIEVKEKRNDKFRKELAYYLETYEQKIANQFEARHESVYKLADLLIFHLSDESLKEYQLETVHEWIQECFHFLSDSSFSQTEKYQKLYKAYVAQLNTETIVPLEHESFSFVKKAAEGEFGIPLESFLNEQEIYAFCQNPNAFMKAYAQKFEKALHSNEQGIEATEENTNLEKVFEQKNVLKNTSVNELYKKLAKVLHPDLEVDEAKKDDKHELMSSLVVARKENDLSTIMKLYQEHIDDAQFEFSEDELIKLIPLLKKKEAKLEQDYEKMKNRSPQTRWIMEHIYGRTLASIQKKIEQAKANVQNQVKNDQELATQISTIRGLLYTLGTFEGVHFIRL